jgi:hypothetical protein
MCVVLGFRVQMKAVAEKRARQVKLEPNRLSRFFLASLGSERLEPDARRKYSPFGRLEQGGQV